MVRTGDLSGINGPLAFSGKLVRNDLASDPFRVLRSPPKLGSQLHGVSDMWTFPSLSPQQHTLQPVFEVDVYTAELRKHGILRPPFEEQPFRYPSALARTPWRAHHTGAFTRTVVASRARS